MAQVAVQRRQGEERKLADILARVFLSQQRLRCFQQTLFRDRFRAGKPKRADRSVGGLDAKKKFLFTGLQISIRHIFDFAGNVFLSEQTSEGGGNLVAGIATFGRGSVKEWNVASHRYVNFFISKPNKIIEQHRQSLDGFLHVKSNNRLVAHTVNVIAEFFEQTGVDQFLGRRIESFLINRLSDLETAGGDHLLGRQML